MVQYLATLPRPLSRLTTRPPSLTWPEQCYRTGQDSTTTSSPRPMCACLARPAPWQLCSLCSRTCSNRLHARVDHWSDLLARPEVEPDLLAGGGGAALLSVGQPRLHISVPCSTEQNKTAPAWCLMARERDGGSGEMWSSDASSVSSGPAEQLARRLARSSSP